MNSDKSVGWINVSLLLTSRRLLIREGHKLESRRPMVPESDDFVHTNFIRSCFDSNLRPRECGARTLPLRHPEL